VTHSKKTAKDIFYGLEHNFPDKTVKLYTGDTPNQTKLDDFRNVDVAWRDVDVVIYNSTCEAGVSCTDPRLLEVFAFFSPSIVTAQASLQMVGRIRSMKRLHFHVSDWHTHGKGAMLPLDEQDVLQSYLSSHLPLPPLLAQNLLGTANGMTITDFSFWKVLYANTRHKNASQMAFQPIFFRLCESAGMEVLPCVTFIGDPDPTLEASVKERREEDADEEARCIAGADDLSLEEKEALSNKQQRNQEEEYQLAKYFLSKKYHVHPTKVVAEFVNKYHHPKVKENFDNLSIIRRHGSDAPSAIARMREQHEAAAHAKVQETWDNVRGNQHARDACLRGWHELSLLIHKPHDVAHTLLEFVTGLPGIHAAERDQESLVAAKTVRLNLGYPVGVRGGVSSAGVASDAVVRELEKLRADIQKYIPACRISPFKRGRVKLKRVISCINSVLGAMYGMQLSRVDSSNFRLEKCNLFEYPGDEEHGAPRLGCWG